MPVKPTRTITKFTNAVLQRNRRLIAILEHMETARSITSEDVLEILNYEVSLTSSRSMLRELNQNGMIEFSHLSGDTVRNSAVHNWKLSDGGLAKARERFLVEAPAGVKLAPPKNGGEAKSYGEWKRKVVDVKVQRDPLDIMLMGHGRAPSLNFRDSLIASEASC